MALGRDGKQAGLQSLDITSHGTVHIQQRFDLWSGTHGYNYIYKHIKGNQDKIQQIHDLDSWALLNI